MDRNLFLQSLPFLHPAPPNWPPKPREEEDGDVDFIEVTELLTSGRHVASFEPINSSPSNSSTSQYHSSVGPIFFHEAAGDEDRALTPVQLALCRVKGSSSSVDLPSPGASTVSTSISFSQQSQSQRALKMAQPSSEHYLLYFRFNDQSVYLVNVTDLDSMAVTNQIQKNKVTCLPPSLVLVFQSVAVRIIPMQVVLHNSTTGSGVDAAENRTSSSINREYDGHQQEHSHTDYSNSTSSPQSQKFNQTKKYLNEAKTQLNVWFDHYNSNASNKAISEELIQKYSNKLNRTNTVGSVLVETQDDSKALTPSKQQQRNIFKSKDTPEYIKTAYNSIPLALKRKHQTLDDSLDEAEKLIKLCKTGSNIDSNSHVGTKVIGSMLNALTQKSLVLNIKNEDITSGDDQTDNYWMRKIDGKVSDLLPPPRPKGQRSLASPPLVGVDKMKDQLKRSIEELIQMRRKHVLSRHMCILFGNNDSNFKFINKNRTQSKIND